MVVSVILLSWLWNHVQSQQVKNNVRLDGSLRGGVMGSSGGANSYGWFLGGFRWFLLVADDIGWFQVVCCFSSYMNFTTYRRIICLRYSWTHVIDWGHSISLIQSKTATKRLLFSCRLAIWKQVIISYTLLCYFLNFLILKNGHKIQSKWSIAKYLRWGVWQRVSEIFSKTGRLLTLMRRREELNQNGEISPCDGERW